MHEYPGFEFADIFLYFTLRETTVYQPTSMSLLQEVQFSVRCLLVQQKMKFLKSR